jgi:3-dehydroquinate synthase
LGADRWGTLAELAPTLQGRNVLAVVDRRLVSLHPSIGRVLSDTATVTVVGGERAKSFAVLERVLAAGGALPRSGTMLAIGGGTVGDLATVAAHLLKRGVALIHVPTTLLAAVDSSLGGKGAIHVRGVKNAAGVFHFPVATWLCEELFATLSSRQRAEGAVEAYKMAACLDARAWRRWRQAPPATTAMVFEARALKSAVCRRDPYERGDARRLLNFGHSFGHVFESLTRFRLPHGAAVCLGILCALDVGRRLGVTPEPVARDVEAGFGELWRASGSRQAPRAALAHIIGGNSAGAIATLLAADKKAGPSGELRMVLLERLGRARVEPVPTKLWRSSLGKWRRGDR